MSKARAQKSVTRPRRSRSAEVVSISATDAKNEFGQVLEKVIQGASIVITKHHSPKAALIPIEQFNSLADTHRTALEALRREWDEKLARMQTPEGRAAMDAAFHATPEELGEAAVAAAAARKRG